MTTTVEQPNLGADDIALTVKLAGCSLATNKKDDNWVDHAGGLPEYICEIARSIKKSGKSTSQAIAIAVSRVKKWAAGGDGVEADTQAKAAKALAQWEKMKAKSKGKTVAASMRHDGSEYIMLSAVPSYNMDRVREAFSAKERTKRELIEQANGLLKTQNNMEPIPCEYRYVREVWNDFLIVEDGKSPQGFIKIPYSVGADGAISWGPETPVVQTYETVKLSNPRPGRQVETAAGAKKYGKPIGADIGPGTKVKFKKNGVTGRIVNVGKPAINSGSNERVVTWQDDKEGGHHVHRESLLEVEKPNPTKDLFAKLKAAAGEAQSEEAAKRIKALEVSIPLLEQQIKEETRLRKFTRVKGLKEQLAEDKAELERLKKK